MFRHEREVLIEWGDCDAAGIVFYPRYFAMFDASTAALFVAASGLGTYDMNRAHGIIGIPMGDTRGRFYVPSRYGDQVRIVTEIAAVRRSSFDVTHKLMRGEVLALEGWETRIWAAPHPTDPARIQGVPIPADLVVKLTA